jgi:glycosyltransferase involved in cell wall biosynthesis
MVPQIAEHGYARHHDELAPEQQPQALVLPHAGNVARPAIHTIMPVLNEEAALRVVLPALPESLRARLIIVDNGSTDGSPAVARAHGARVVREDTRGYGAACLAGLAAVQDAADDDVILFLDGDASDDLCDIPAVTGPVERGEADLVIGSRMLGRCERGALALHSRFGNWLAATLIYRRTGVRFTDLGPLRAIRMDALRQLAMRDRAFGWTVEMQLKAAQHGLRTMEVPVNYRRRIGKSKISGTLSGSVRAGITILRTIAQHGR